MFVPDSTSVLTENMLSPLKNFELKDEGCRVESIMLTPQGVMA
jgi:hypothetical protein